MNFEKNTQNIQRIVDALQDEQSRTLFAARLDFLKSGDKKPFYKVINDLYRGQWRCPMVDRVWDKALYQKIAVFGCKDGGRTLTMLKVAGYELDCFCDDDPSVVGTFIRGIPVRLIDDIANDCKDYLIILGSQEYAEQKYQFLIEKGIPQENILYDSAKGFQWVQTLRGEQYFDVCPPVDEEVFVDAGAYDGQTTLQFAAWSKGNYKKIYSIEPTAAMYQLAKDNCRGLERVEFLQNAVWDKEENILFFEDSANMAASCVGQGDFYIRGRAIDDMVGNEKVTFIKMDVEGAELSALRGAKNTIVRDKPRLAISIYHKLEDIIELPDYILSLVPEYKLFIRHYSANTSETVLYAML